MEWDRAWAQFKRASRCDYRGCTVQDRTSSLKIRGFVPKALAPGVSDGQRDFTRQYGTRLNPGDAAKRETAFRAVLDVLDHILAA